MGLPIYGATTDTSASGDVYNGLGNSNQIMIGNVLYVADSAEDLQNALDYVSSKSNKPVSELRYTDMSRAFVYNSFSNRLGSGSDNFHAGWVVNLSSARLSNVDSEGNTPSVTEFAHQEYFDNIIPMYTNHQMSLLSWPGFDTSKSGVSGGAQAAGLAGAVQSIYTDNYKNKPELASPIDAADLNPQVLSLIHELFGSNVEPNKGQLNTLKMLGLVSGNATAGTSTWTLSQTGQSVLDGVSQSTTHFVPSLALLSMSQASATIMTNAAGYFTSTGYASGFDSAFVENQAKTIHDEMAGSSDGSDVAHLTIPNDSASLMNHLFKLANGNTTFTNAQVNSAIALGLLTFDGADAVSNTTNGGIYLNNSTQTPPATTADHSIAGTYHNLATMQHNLDLLNNNWSTFANADGSIDRSIFQKYKDEGNFNNISPELYQMALDMAFYSNSNVLDPLYRGNTEYTDGRFSKDEFNTFRSGVDGLVQVLTKSDGTADTELRGNIIDSLTTMKDHFDPFERFGDHDHADGWLSQYDMIKASENGYQAASKVLTEQFDAGGGWLRNLIFGGDGYLNSTDLDRSFALTDYLLQPTPSQS